MTPQTFSSDQIRRFVAAPAFDPAVITRNDTSFPRISIVVPSFNQATFLRRTLWSILNQNYPNTEIIVLDAGSTDGSVDIIREFEPFLAYWVSRPDRGQSDAINRGFAQATGDLLAWQNSDDLYLPGFFHRVAETWQRYPEALMIHGNACVIDPDERILEETRFPPFSVGYLVYVRWNLTSQAVFLQRDLVRDVGPLREDIHVGFDWDWFIRIGRRLTPRQAVLLRAQGGCYRIHPASKLSTQDKLKRWQIDREILRRQGIQVDESLSYEEQRWWQRHLYGQRDRLLRVLLYSANRNLARIRPLVVRLLRLTGRCCLGFTEGIDPDETTP